MASHPPIPLNEAQRWVGPLTLTLISAIGAIAIFAPFWSPIVPTGSHLTDSPLVTAVLTIACLVVVFANLGPSLNAKATALLGVLVGINIALRIADQSFFPAGEFSPIFLLIILVGYVFGAQMGFLMGAFSLLCSAFFTGGVGPWLPFQMFTAGWMGLCAAWIPGKSTQGTLEVKRGELLRLIAFGFVWGFIYGAIMNLYFWPFIAGGSTGISAAPGTVWTPGISFGETIQRYGAFYLLTSVSADLQRALTNTVLLSVLGVPLLKVFRRFRSRFDYQTVEIIQTEPS
jgi:energy-coupling factor transport system substrate-specific component